MSSLSKLLSKGGSLAREGDTAGARAVFEKAVREFATSSDAWINLSAVHGMQGNFSEALKCARKAVQLMPGSLQGWMNLANAAASCGELAQAAEAYQRVLGMPGCPPDLQLNLGITLARLGRWIEAKQPLREFRARHPGHREATLVLCKAMANTGEAAAAAAINEEYCRQRPEDLGALLELGHLYHASGQIPEAWRICEQAAVKAPDAFDVLFFKAALLRHEGRAAEARDIYEQLDRAYPGTPRILMALAQTCWELSDGDACIAYSQAALKLEPGNVSAMLSLSSALIYRDIDAAWRWLEQALAVAPDEPAVLVLKAELLEFRGDKAGAWECVQSAMRSGYVDLQVAKIAANVAPAVGKSAEAIAQLERLVDQPEVSFSDARILRFKLAHLCDKTKQYDRAFEHAVIANRLKNARHDDTAHVTQINRLKAVYSAEAASSLPRSNLTSEIPVFIVGMPRSGTSLVEQILSCHSRVHARGETSDIPSIAESIPYYPDGVRNLTPEKLDALASAHLRRISESAPAAAVITDKLPGNFLLLGIISQLFPAARVLNCRRDPRDVCLSNFMIDYGAGHNYSYDIESLALTCKSYQELMEHWKQVLTVPIMDVRYEELVRDPRAYVERILTFCGLEWEDACLNFHNSARQVATASYDQVRRPMYAGSIARWKNYAQHLEPVARILDLDGDDYP